MKLFHRHDLEKIGRDEPVFVIRASDAEGPNVLRKYAFLLRARHHGAEKLAEEIEEFAGTMFEWQHAEGNAAPPPEVALAEEAARAKPVDPKPERGKDGPR